jgi:ABC-type transporter Mla MlaB component
MSLDVAHYPEEHRLDVAIEGDLDLTLTSRILEACKFVDAGLVICVIDVTRVSRVFDSGLAILMLLTDLLAQFQVRLVIVGNITGFEPNTLPGSLQPIVCISSEELQIPETPTADLRAYGKGLRSSRIQLHQSGARQ